MRTLTAAAPTKLNLTLRVLGRRPDGYHEIESLVALVDATDATDPAGPLCDTLTVTEHEDGCYALACDDPALPRDGSNLVLAAARALARTASVNRGAEFTLQKRIPLGAGLGGGSSDAATALKLLNDLWDLDYPAQRLAAIGAEVGSDVPLFFQGPLVVVRGRGERVEPAIRGESETPADPSAPGARITRGDRPHPRSNCWAAVLLPDLRCSTPAVYSAWDRQHTPQDAEPDANRPRIEEIVAALPDVRAMPLLFNDLEAPAFEICPGLRDLHATAEQIAGGPVRMTGSGAALFRLFPDGAPAADLAKLAAAELQVRAVAVRIGGRG
ncbi:MAG: hypothetical protein AB1716_03895 [Planctomycetota bacterium]